MTDQQKSRKLKFSTIFLFILLITLIAEFLIWYAYPNEEKGTINGSGIYYQGVSKYLSAFLILGLIYFGLGFFCFLRAIYLLFLRFRGSERSFLWLIWLVITLLFLLGGYLNIEYGFDIAGGSL